MFRSLRNFIIIKTDSLFEDKVSFRGSDGMELVIDVDFDRQRHTRIYGECTDVPLYLGKVPLHQEHRGLPEYHGYSPYYYKFMSDIEMEVQVGDRVYFHFNSVVQRNFVDVQGKHPNRTWFIKVRYDQILCVVRDGKIIPIGGYALIEPEYETWDDILVPVPMTVNGKVLKDKYGEVKYKPKDQWIQTKIAPQYKYLTGFVRHVGSPLNGDKCEIEVGQKIWYRKNADWPNKIEGKEYFTIRQRHIIGRQTKNT